MWSIIIALICINYATALPPKIVNGTNAEESEIPYIISLRSYGSHSCGGSIIDETHILTAGHCSQGSQYTIQYGVLDIRTDVNIIKVIRVQVHEDYSPWNNYANDVSVMTLESPIPLDGVNIKPVNLPSQSEVAPAGSWAVLAGWGATYTGGPAANLLQRVDILVYSPQDCSAAHGSSVDERYHLCAGVPEGWKGQCSGDSGGPLVAQGKQVGAVSWSVKPCAIVGYPGVFARVASYVDWIKDKAASK